MTYTFVQRDLLRTISDMKTSLAFTEKLLQKVEGRDVSGMSENFSDNVKEAKRALQSIIKQLSDLYFDRYGESIE